MKYAEHTVVPVEKSKIEIERLLTRYGATQFAHGWDEHTAHILFQMHERRIRFYLPLPREESFRSRAGYEQACRQRWRALALVIKAKLEAVETKITSFEDEFLAHIVMPDGQTVGQHVGPTIAEAYSSWRMPPLLLPHYGPEQ